MVIQWSNREQKKEQRNIIFNGINKVQNYLTLPGDECIDIMVGIEKGIIDNKTFIHAVERDKKVAQKIEKIFQTFSSPTLLEKCELCETKLSNIYDLVFLDLMGNVRKQELMWIKNTLSKHVSNNSRIGLTVSKNPRGNLFFTNLCEEIKKYSPEKIKEKEISWRNNTDHPKSSLRNIAIYNLLIEYALYPYEFSLECYSYYDSTTMFFFLINITGKTKEKLEIQSVFDKILNVQTKVTKMSSTRKVTKMSFQELLEKCLNTTKNYNTIRGLKRSITVYCNKKSKETGLPFYRFLAALKANITRKGGNTEWLNQPASKHSN